MIEFQNKDDAHIAKELVRLGKTADCKCKVFLNPMYGKPPQVLLRGRLTCPVHYPETLAVLRGGIDDWV